MQEKLGVPRTPENMLVVLGIARDYDHARELLKTRDVMELIEEHNRKILDRRLVEQINTTVEEE